MAMALAMEGVMMGRMRGVVEMEIEMGGVMVVETWCGWLDAGWCYNRLVLRWGFWERAYLIRVIVWSGGYGCCGKVCFVWLWSVLRAMDGLPLEDIVSCVARILLLGRCGGKSLGARGGARGGRSGRGLLIVGV